MKVALPGVTFFVPFTGCAVRRLGNVSTHSSSFILDAPVPFKALRAGADFVRSICQIGGWRSARTAACNS